MPVLGSIIIIHHKYILIKKTSPPFCEKIVFYEIVPYAKKTGDNCFRTYSSFSSNIETFKMKAHIRCEKYEDRHIRAE